MTREFVISKDKLHRLKLKYTWDRTKPAVLFIMLNPSYMRPDGQLSPTSKVVIDWAKQNDYGSLLIGNLFSFITPSPLHLFGLKVPIVTDENDVCLKQMAKEAKDIYFAWGKFDPAYNRSRQVKQMFPTGRALFKNRDGSPAHPMSANFLHKIIAK